MAFDVPVEIYNTMDTRFDNFLVALLAQDGRFDLKEEKSDFVQVRYRSNGEDFTNIGTTIACSKHQCLVACNPGLPEPIKDALKRAADETGFNFEERDPESPEE